MLSIKLDNPGFNTSAMKLIGNFLSDRVQSVVLNDILSDSVSIERSVPQGTILEPLSFNLLHINDMHEKVDNKTELIQYADDTFIFTSDHSN